MSVITQTIRVDLNTGKVIPTAFVHQNDTARSLVFDMYLNGEAFNVSSYTVKFAYVSPTVNGQHTVISGNSMASGLVSDNKVTVTLPSAYTAISGVGLLTMIITPSSGTIRPVNIRLVVQKSADGDDVIAQASDFPNYVGNAARSWMQETYGDLIDGTLSLRNRAADAMVTGDKISQLFQMVNALALKLSDIPSYWKTFVDNKLADIKSLRASTTNPFTVMFVTDVHYEDNNLKSPELMEYIQANGVSDSVVCGGDIIIQQPTKQAAIDMMIAWREKCKSLNMAYCVGNHDLNGQENQSDTSVQLSEAEWLNIFPSDVTGVTYFTHPSGDPTAFGYRDHPSKKIREVFINTGAIGIDNNAHFSTNLHWAVGTLLSELTSDWGVIIYAHKYWQPGQLSDGSTESVAQYISQYMPTTLACEVIALITGHCHNDNYTYDPTHGYIILSTTCDSSGAQASNLDRVNPIRTAGTTTEQAFDVITIDRTEKMIYLKRMGAGSDRSYRYTNQETPAGYFAIQNRLTNATTSNSATTVAEGSSYTAVITPVSGYTITSATVTMGGQTITHSINSGGGSVSIASVTADVIITVVASDVFSNAVASSFTSIDDTSVFNTTGYRDGYYLSNYTSYSASTGYAVTGVMPWELSLTDTPTDATALYIYGVTDGFADSKNRFAFIHQGRTRSTLMSSANSLTIADYFTIETLGTNYYKLTPKSSDVSGRGTFIAEKKGSSVEYIQCSFKCSGANLVIGMGREIPSSYRS